MSKATADLLAKARRWAEVDPDPQTRAQLEKLLAADDQETITKLFAGRLKFGTAGLRAELGAGPLRMNRVVVRQTTAGFAKYLLKRHADGLIQAEKPLVVVGFDARKNSDVFAHDTVQVLAGYGLDALLLPGPLPTPVTAFAVRHYNAAAGIMITASHNPPRDNGYKVYLGDADGGSQIAPPQDSEIAEFIDEIAEADFNLIKCSDDYRTASDFLLTEYIAATNAHARELAKLREHHESKGLDLQQPAIVYTAMHGVGAAITSKLFALAGIHPLIMVAQQQHPDPDFPTVDFPNPEEKGALDLAYARAALAGADLILAHDPDADRLAVALPAPGATSRTAADYRMLTGNQLGLLLGWQAAKRVATEQHDERNPLPTLANTIVSSPALKTVAAHYGLAYQETLSGFKWISRVPGLVFGFEEALGYLVNPQTVRDKDGISAALIVADIAGELFRAGKTLWDLLDEATELFGAFASGQITLRFADVSQAEQLIAQVRKQPPTHFGELAVTGYTDLANSSDPAMRANVLRFTVADSARVMMRPSGTEPKLKIYLDTHATVGTVAERNAAAAAQLEQLSKAVQELLQQ